MPHFSPKADNAKESACKDRRLAAAVVCNAVADYNKAVRWLNKNRHATNYLRDTAIMDRDEAIAFLTGQTEIARFWLATAGVSKPFDLERLLEYKELEYDEWY